MTSILQITHFKPSSTGHGGNHRTYQISYDCKKLVGEENVHVIDMREWYPSRKLFMSKLRRNFGNYVLQTPKKYSRFNPRRFNKKGFYDFYKSFIESLEKPIIAIVEHPDFSQVVELNMRLKIRSIACPHNIESIDSLLPIRVESYDSYDLISKKLGFELYNLSKYDERLLISKIETGFLNGLGLSSKYYPYLPVGEIERRMSSIRKKRNNNGIKKGLFLLMGTATHGPTGDGFGWFLENVIRYGLPEGVKIIAIGRGTDNLIEENLVRKSNILCKGFIPQKDLDRIMEEIQAVLIPQFCGFGSLTRVVELANAGVPIIMSRTQSYAIDLPPGVDLVGDRWDEWYDCMDNAMYSDFNSDLEEYYEWLNAQEKALNSLLRNYLD